MGREYRNIVRSRKLAERSYLYFKYPSADNSVEFYLPFMENIEVSESQRPNLATYDLIGRNGTLFAYLGTKSREMNLKFNITLPNIIDYIHTVGLSDMFSDNFRKVILGMNKSEERRKFLRVGKTEESSEKVKYTKQGKFDYYTEGKKDMYEIDASFRDGNDAKEVGTLGSFFQGLTEGLNKKWFLGNLFNGDVRVRPGFADITAKEAVNYLMMWINVIRSSVLNNSRETQYGPPTVYLNHGTMYNNIPCICTNYSVRLVNNAGYDILSLAPRQVEVTMNLSETRVGNFDKFVPFDEVAGDNLTGWESVMLDEGTMDPHNQLLRIVRKSNLDLVEKEKEEATDLVATVTVRPVPPPLDTRSPNLQ